MKNFLSTQLRDTAGLSYKKRKLSHLVPHIVVVRR